MFHVLILGTCCTKKKIRIRINSPDSITERHAPIYNEGLILYQASSKRATIPIGFCKCKYNKYKALGKQKKIEEYLKGKKGKRGEAKLLLNKKSKFAVHICSSKTLAVINKILE